MPDDDRSETTASRPSFLERLGPAALGERPAPRLTGVLGAAGGIIAVAGVFTLLTELPEDGRRASAGAISLLLVVAGALLLQSSTSPATRAAGVTAFAAGLWPLMFVVAVQTEPTITSGDTRTFFVLLTAAWLVAYLAGPARGHALLLGLTLWGAWVLVTTLVDAGPWLIPGTEHFTFGNWTNHSGPGGMNSVSALSLLVAGAYLFIAVALDRRGRQALATPFVAVAHVAWLSGLALLWAQRSTTLGALGIVAGLAVAGFGVAMGRRFTAWLGALVLAAAAAGLILLNVRDDTVAVGLLLLASGSAVVLLAYLVAPALGEGGPLSTRQPDAPVG